MHDQEDADRGASLGPRPLLSIDLSEARTDALLLTRCHDVVINGDMTWKAGSPRESSLTTNPSPPEQSPDAGIQSERPESRSSLFAAHLGDLAGYLRRRCGVLLRAKESVSDLAQSVCREALTHWSRFRSGSDRDRSLRKWLFHIARRKLSVRQG